MKKVVLNGFAMLLCGVAFVACSHNDASFDEGYQAKSEALQRETKYEDAFVKAFGPIAPGHQWGFDQTNVAGTRAGVSDGSSAFTGWALPNDLTSVKENKKFSKAIREAFVSGQGVATVDFPLTNYWMQHVCEPDGKNGQNSLTDVQAYDSSTGNWVTVVNFSDGQNNVVNQKPNTRLKGTTLMSDMGGAPYNNEQDATDPANGKYFRYKENGEWNYNYKFIKNDYGTFLGLQHKYEQGNSGKMITTYWVIMISPASSIADNVVAEGRVFCEDKGNIGDFDFNDVVFDAQIFQSGKVSIKLLAAGGTLPVTVAGKDVNALMGKMVNTNIAGAQHAPVSIELTASEAAALGITSILTIPVVVTPKEGDPYELSAFAGQAPAKVCTFRGVDWADEYANINKAYSGFSDWAQHNTTPATWSEHQDPIYTDLDLTNNQ